MRQIKVVPTAQAVDKSLCENSIVVVIDVLRATSVITTALQNGAKAVYPFADIESARHFYAASGDDSLLLCGERQGHIIDGFHLGNSPFSYTPETVQGKSLLLSTTNGSLAISRSTNAKMLFAASFLNISAVANLISSFHEDVLIVCAGTNGFFSLDDALCAGMLIGLIGKNDAFLKDDFSVLLHQFGEQEGSIPEKLKNCQHLNYLKSIGYEADVEYCLTPDLLKVIPVLCKDSTEHRMEIYR